MKQLFYTTLLALMGVMALTSCTGEAKRGDQLTAMLSVESTQDLIDACDIEITYKGKGGINRVDTITTTEWHKIVVNDSFPVKIGMIRLKYLVKPGFKPTKDTYDLECQYTLSTKETESERQNMELRLLNVPAGKVISLLDLKNYFTRDYVKREADTDFYLCSICMVSRAEDESARDLFIFYDDVGLNELQEEIPVENPDSIGK